MSVLAVPRSTAMALAGKNDFALVRGQNIQGSEYGAGAPTWGHLGGYR
jgi:hypothetical protein